MKTSHNQPPLTTMIIRELTPQVYMNLYLTESTIGSRLNVWATTP